MTTPSTAAIRQELRGRHEQATRLSASPLTLALTVAVPLALAYLILAPPAGDLAAATYRSDLFARVGLTTWDTGWYAAHGYWLPGYSLLSPVLGALLGVRLLLTLSAVAACALFALIAQRVFGMTAARLAAAWFALGFCVGLLSGRVPYDLGFAIGLASVLALMLADRGSRRVPRMGYRSPIGKDAAGTVCFAHKRARTQHRAAQRAANRVRGVRCSRMTPAGATPRPAT